jgi:hypothetical protein
MTISLVEGVIASVLTTLQAELATELAAIYTARGDTIALDSPEAWHNHAISAAGGKGPIIEVYESEDLVFKNPYSDADAKRATYDQEIAVRGTLINHQSLNPDDFRTQVRRYATAVYNVFLNNRLLDEIAPIKLATVTTMIWETDFDEEASGYEKWGFEVLVEVRIEEYYA